MPRVKRWVMTKKRHKKLIKNTKWFRLLNSKVFSRAKNAWMKAGQNAYIGRKLKKRTFRQLWITRLNTALKMHDERYSLFINKMFKKNVKLNRKVLSNLAISDPKIFKWIVEFVK